MFEWTVGGVRCRVSLLFPALLAALLMVQPDGLAVTCLLAAVLHEGGHLLAMLCLGYPPAACTLSAFGVRLELSGERLPGYRHNLLISFAGPAMNGLAVMLLWMFRRPEAAMVHLCLGGFNLLPAGALDGGQMVRCMLCLHGGERQAERWLPVFSAFVLLPLAAFSFYLFFSGQGNGTLAVVSVYLVLLLFFS